MIGELTGRAEGRSHREDRPWRYSESEGIQKKMKVRMEHGEDVRNKDHISSGEDAKETKNKG